MIRLRSDGAALLDVNLVQATITALKMVESVLNELEMISNQIKQLENMILNTQNFGRWVWDGEALPRLMRAWPDHRRGTTHRSSMSRVVGSGNVPR